MGGGGGEEGVVFIFFLEAFVRFYELTGKRKTSLLCRLSTKQSRYFATVQCFHLTLFAY